MYESLCFHTTLASPVRQHPGNYTTLLHLFMMSRLFAFTAAARLLAGASAQVGFESPSVATQLTFECLKRTACARPTSSLYTAYKTRIVRIYCRMHAFLLVVSRTCNRAGQTLLAGRMSQPRALEHQRRQPTFSGKIKIMCLCSCSALLSAKRQRVLA